jgi:predicted lipid-binding transport protein (Tim44 family)
MKKLFSFAALTILVFFVTALVFEPLSYARAGGGRSFGGGKSFSSSPSRPNSFSQPKNYSNSQTSNRGGLLKSIGGGIIGGMMGSMLFRALGFGGGGGGGLLQILIFAGIGYMIFRFIRSRSGRAEPASGTQSINSGGFFKGNSGTADASQSGLSAIMSSDPSFDERNFKDNVMDMFFKIQAAWMNRDLSTVSNLLDVKMKDYLQSDIDQLLSSGKINRLENIAVRNINIDDAWQESDSDCITVLIYANILDYTVDEKNGNVLEGSKTEPVKFEEYWTFFRTMGTGNWKLSAINQK